MDATISKLTPETLQQQAREAAEQGIPLSEANHHEQGSLLWFRFNTAYRAAARAAQAVEAA